MKRIILTLYIIGVFMTWGYAQEKESIKLDGASVGLGLGYDYGGIGVNFVTYPQRNIGFSLGAGYGIVDFLFNGGIKLRYAEETSSAKVHPFFTAMYGKNTFVVIENATHLNRFFYGFTFGIGVDLSLSKRKHGYWAIAITIPKRSSSANDYIKDLRMNNGVRFQSSQEVGFSLGYKFIIR